MSAIKTKRAADATRALRLPLVLASSVVVASARAQTWNPASEFSLTANQGVNDVWSYRNGANSGSLLNTPLPLDGGFGGWSGRQATGFGTFPYIQANLSGGTDPLGWTPNDLLFHPGPDGTEAALRWTAPTSGLYRVAGSFRRYQNTSTNVFITRGATTVFSGTVTPNALSAFDQTLVVPTGGFLEFAVGDGGNGYGSDATLFQLSLQAVPEPAPLAALTLGVLALLRRRRTA